MSQQSKQFRSVLTAMVAASGMTISTLASAAGFIVPENNARGLGTAFAGNATLAKDASSNFNNPAALTRIPGTVVTLSGVVITGDANFQPSAATNSAGFSAGLDITKSSELETFEWIPSFHLSHQLNDKLWAGFSMTAPFGLSTEVDEQSVQRYFATDTSLITLNFNPNIAYKLNDQLSIAGGVNVTWARAILNRMVDGGSICAQMGVAACAQSGNNDFEINNSGDDFGYGWNLAAHWQMNDQTELGVSYRSQTHFLIKGETDYTVDPSNTQPVKSIDVLSGADPRFVTQGVTASLTTPDTFSIGVAHKYNANWKVMADAQWTNWSKFDLLVLDFETLNDNTTEEHWEDVWRYAVGVEFSPEGSWEYRAGLAFDASPVPDADRTSRAPDADRVWYSFGASYAYSEMMTFDFGYAYVDIDDSHLNERDSAMNNPQTGITIQGDYSDGEAHLLTAQMNLRF